MSGQTNDGLVYWYIYASLSLNELSKLITDIITAMTLEFILLMDTYQHRVSLCHHYRDNYPGALTLTSPGQNGHHFDRLHFQQIFESIFLNENNKILIKISLKLVPRSPIDNNPALVQVMAWHQIGAKPLSEPMMIQFTDEYIRH